MNKIFSLTKAVMSEGLNIFRFKTKKNPKNKILIGILAIYLIAVIYFEAYRAFEFASTYNLVPYLLVLLLLLISVFILLEGIYKAGPILFKCKDDDLLFSLPIKKITILLVRLFKFFVFEFILNSAIVIPVLAAYSRFEVINASFIVTNLFSLILLPMIPISISAILGFIISYISSKIRFKNLIQTILSALAIFGIYYIMFKIDTIKEYIINNSSNINEMVNKIYYPLGLYLKLITEFNILDLLKYIGINLIIYIATIYLLSLTYFKISSNIKEVPHKTKSNTNYNIKSNKPITSLIKKEINTFFKTPVLLLNAGFSLAMYLIIAIFIFIKYDDFNNTLEALKLTMEFDASLIMSNISVFFVIALEVFTLTSTISSSLISLEGKTFNILKTIPVKPSKILLAKVLGCLLITTPILLIGDIILFVKLKLTIVEMLVILLLTILVPLQSHFIGILCNLKLPKFDYDNAAEVVKQSGAVLISTLLGLALAMTLLGLNLALLFSINLNKDLILLINVLIFIVADSILYLLFNGIGIKLFNKLSI